MALGMEQLLHYTWKHRLFPATTLQTAGGETVEVIDPGLHNQHAGPDFFNAKVRIGGQLWVGNVEIHERSSDWYRHGHDHDAAYNNTILHVVSVWDRDVLTEHGIWLPQLQISVPSYVLENYQELLAEERYPPCYRVVPQLGQLTVHAWMSALAVERLEEKTARIEDYLAQTEGDWERAFFITLARNFGFGVNTEAFEEWAFGISLSAAGKHRDNLLQVEALFLGQAGLLEEGVVPTDRQDNYYLDLTREYQFLRTKFGLQPMRAQRWCFLRLRPQNFPHVRLSQLAMLFHAHRVDLSRLLEVENGKQARELFRATAAPYWQSHYTFGREAASTPKTLRESSLDLLIINTLAPVMFAYGRGHHDEPLCERAFAFLEETKPERNHIIRSWAGAGITAESAADSQAMIQLKTKYCDRKDCLRCRFGTAYLKRSDHGAHF